MVTICPVFKWHSNTRSLGIRPIFNHLNTKLVHYSDPTEIGSKVCLNKVSFFTHPTYIGRPRLSIQRPIVAVVHSLKGLWTFSLFGADDVAAVLDQPSLPPAVALSPPRRNGSGVQDFFDGDIGIWLFSKAGDGGVAARWPPELLRLILPNIFLKPFGGL